MKIEDDEELSSTGLKYTLQYVRAIIWEMKKQNLMDLVRWKKIHGYGNKNNLMIVA